jgi:hypothetical protein
MKGVEISAGGKTKPTSVEIAGVILSKTLVELGECWPIETGDSQ